MPDLPDDAAIGVENAMGYVGHKLEEARLKGRVTSLSDLADKYDHPNPSDYSRVRYFFFDNDLGVSDRALVEALLLEAIKRLGKAVEAVEGGYVLTKPLARVKYRGKALRKHWQLPSALERAERHGIREELGDLTELAESLKEDWNVRGGGYIIRDRDTGQIVSGNRRLAAAELAGINPTPYIHDETFRSPYARQRWVSKYNAHRPLSDRERRFKIEAEEEARELAKTEAARLKGEGLTQQAIAIHLGTARETVRNWLGEESYVEFGQELKTANSDEPRKRGRKALPVTPDEQEDIGNRYFVLGQSMDKIGEEVLGIKSAHSRASFNRIIEDQRKKRGLAPDETSTPVDIPKPEPEPVSGVVPPQTPPAPVNPPPKPEPKPREPEEHEHDWEERCKECGAIRAA